MNSTGQNSTNKTHDNPEILFGRHTILEFLTGKNQINKLFLQKGISGKAITDILNLVKQQGVIYQEVPKAKLDQLADGQNHQGVVIIVPPFEYQTIEDGLALARRKNEAPFFLILDGVEDPHNLGSILRTADATGVHGVIIPKRRSASLTGVVAKISTGAIAHVPVVRVTNLKQAVEALKSQGIWVFATDMVGQDMREWPNQGPIALIIGNEGKGVSPSLKQVADGVVTIPMRGHVQSLNASVAASILMYEVARYRIPKSGKGA